MQIVVIDIMGHLPENRSGNSYMLVLGDYFTKWTEADAIPNKKLRQWLGKSQMNSFLDFPHWRHFTQTKAHCKKSSIKS